MRTDRTGWSLAWASIALAVTGQMLIKWGATGHVGFRETLAASFRSPTVLLGLAAYAVSSALWLVVLSRLPVSAVYPMGSVSYALVVLAAWALGEHVPPLRWAGVAFIVAGVLLVGLRAEREAAT